MGRGGQGAPGPARAAHAYPGGDGVVCVYGASGTGRFYVICPPACFMWDVRVLRRCEDTNVGQCTSVWVRICVCVCVSTFFAWRDRETGSFGLGFWILAGSWVGGVLSIPYYVGSYTTITLTDFGNNIWPLSEFGSHSTMTQPCIAGSTECRPGGAVAWRRGAEAWLAAQAVSLGWG